jgi:hypothetical protein
VRCDTPKSIAVTWSGLCLLGSVVAVGLLVLASSVPARGPLAGAALVVATRTRDLGATAAELDLRIPFPIGNAGQRRLVLNQLDPACHCDDRVLRTIVVRPRAVEDVLVTLDTHGVAGKFEHHVYYTTNDPAHPRLKLTVRGHVLTPNGLDGES